MLLWVIHKLDAYAASWMVATLLVMVLLPVLCLYWGVQSYLYANILGFFVC
jgi:hypothetical protein